MKEVKLNSVSYNLSRSSRIEIKNERDTQRALSCPEMMKLYMEIRRLREQVSREEAIRIRR